MSHRKEPQPHDWAMTYGFWKLLNRLSDVQVVGQGEYKARCPAHDDKCVSLRLWLREDETPAFYCQAGCPLPAILDAVGLRWSDICGAKGRRSRRREGQEAASTEANQQTVADPAPVQRDRSQRREADARNLAARQRAGSDYLTLAEAAQKTPGRPTSSTIWRWARHGLTLRNGREVHLQYVRVGGRMYTTEQWLADFMEAVTAADLEDVPLRHPNRQPRSEYVRHSAREADRALREAGA